MVSFLLIFLLLRREQEHGGLVGRGLKKMDPDQPKGDDRMSKRVVVTGATGMIGRPLCRKLLERGYELTVFSRDPEAARKKVPGASGYVGWQPEESGPWGPAVDGAHGVVSLAGDNLFVGHLSEERLRAGDESRVVGTRGLVEAIGRATEKPQVLVSASSTGYYGFEGWTDEEVTENSSPVDDLWSRGSTLWEAEALRAEGLGTRVVLLRIGVVLKEGEGPLAYQVPRFRSGWGGPTPPGDQWWPWIHVDDVVGLFLMALENQEARGPINASSPGVVGEREYAETLGRVLGQPADNQMPESSLRQYMGLSADIVMHLRRVVPEKALGLGYRFEYPTLEPALRDLVADGVAGS